MADIRRVPHSAVSLPGTGGGQPHYERNTLLPVTELIVGTGTPRLYDEIVSQWGVVRAEYEDLRSAAADLEVETERCGATSDNPDGDETPEEARFNDALEDLLLGDRLHIEAGDGHDRGIGHLLAWGVESIAYGFSIAEPYWIEGGGIYTARVCVRPLERSAAYRWGVDRDGYRPGPHPTCLYYLTAEAGQQEIPYDELLHITNPGARPGHWYGLAPLLRACVPLFLRWRQNQMNAAGAELASRGRLVITEPESDDPENATRIDGIVEADAEGRISGFRLPHGTTAQLMFPSGSPPDFRNSEQGLTESVRSIFANGAAALGLSTHGSRAVAAEMGAEDRRRASARRNEIIGKIWHRMCAWVARQEGYTGRLRGLKSVESEQIVDVPVWVDTIGRAVQAGVLTLSDADRRIIREKMGLPEMQEAAPQAGLAEEHHPERYQGIDFSVSDGMRDAAKRALEVRAKKPESQQGMTSVGIARARDISNGRDLSPDTWRRVKAYFDRHQSDKDGETWDQQGKGWQAWHGWGGDAGYARARKIVGQMDAADREAKASEGCGCGACSVPLSEDAETWDIGGYAATRPPLTITVKGVDVQPEMWLAWADEQAERATLDAEITQDYAEIAERHRAAVWDALEDITPEEYRPGMRELERTFADAVVEYEAAAERYVQRVRANTAVEVERAAERQAESGTAPRADGDVDLDKLRADAERQIENARNAAMIAAETAASRVQSEVERAWTAGGTRAGFASRITERGLSQEARSAGNQAEVAATLEVAADPERVPSGWRIVALARTAVLDDRRCDHCRAQDGATFVEDESGDLVGDGQTKGRISVEGVPWERYNDLPDPECEGGAINCRCRWVAVWGR